MEFEANRLCTFTNWPQNSSVNSTELAKHGFYATGDFHEAQCHWCQCKISDWNIGDTVELRHRKISPTCNFLTTENCGNVPIPTENPQHTPDMFNEEERLATFSNWPNTNIEPDTLAKAGFFYLKRSDEVMCAWCHGVIAKWMVGDDAFQEHQRFFPDCPRAKLGRLITVSDGLDKLCIQTTVKPHNPKYASLDARLRTYEKWPISHVQQPNLLARAGLYFQGFDDQVRCFHCNIGLRSWQKEDDPLAEHLKWSSDCYFVSLVTGPNKTLATTSNHNNESAAALPTTSNTQISTDTIENCELASTSNSSLFENHLKLAEEHRHLKEARLCKICLDEEVGVVFLPCGHLVTCFQCAPSITQCPICRSDIKGVVRAYLS